MNGRWRSTFILFTSLLGPSLVWAQPSGSSEVRDAVREYILESSDYVKTLQDSRIEIRRWRSQLLREQFESKLQEIERTLIKSNQEVLAEVEKAIQQDGLDSLDDILLMRMAQLYFERENLLLSQKMKAYEHQLTAFLSGRLAKAPALPVPNYKSTIEYSKSLLTKYPRSPLSDKAHYLIGYALEEMGQYESAIEIYKRLLRRHPFTSLGDEVKWRMGEHWFDQRDLNKAAFYYNELSQKKDSPYRLKALYKLGASYFAGGKYPQSAPYFVQLYKETSEAGEDNRENETLYEEALEYLGILQSYGVVIDLDKNTLAEATKRLARAYQRLPNELRARNVYIDFMKRELYSPRVPVFANEVIQSYLSDANFGQAENLRERIVTFLTKDRQWWKANFFDRPATFEAEDFLEDYLLASAQSHAEKGFERRDKNELRLAREKYLQFLRSYPFSRLSPRARFELAQVEYFSGLFAASKESFEFVMNDPAADAFLDDAAYGYLWSVTRQIDFPMDREVSLTVKRNDKGEVLPPQNLSEKEKTFLAAAQVYISKAPIGTRRQRVLYKVAEIHFGNNNFELAQKALDMVIEDKENISLTTAKALRLSAEIANVKGDWQAVSARNAELMSLSFSADTKGAEVGQVTAGSQALETASRFENSGQRLEAAKEYDRLALALPRATFTPYSNWKAAQLYRDEGKYKESLETLTRLKGTEYEKEASYLRAANLKSLMSFRKAAEEFEAFAKANPKHVWAPDALFSAASLRRDLKQNSAAVDLFVKYFSYKQVDTVLFEAMELLGQSGETQKIELLIGYLPAKNVESKARGRSLLAEAHWRKAQVQQVGAICRSIVVKASKNNSAQNMRTRAQCRYYELSLKAGKVPAVDATLAAAKELEESGQPDLAARLLGDAGDRLIKEAKTSEARTLLREGWRYAKRNPYSEVGQRIYSSLIKVEEDYPANIGSLVNWRLADANLFNWLTPPAQQLAWGNARSLCEREEFDDCLREVESLAAGDPSEEMAINRILAYLRAGQDLVATDFLKRLGDRQNWPDHLQRMAILLGRFSDLPSERKDVTIPEQIGRAEAFVARAELRAKGGDLKGALEDIESAIAEDSSYQGSYLSLARLLHESGHWELVREVLRGGVQNSKSRSGLQGMLYIWDVVSTSGSSKTLSEPTDQNDARALWGLGVAAKLADNSKLSEATQTLLDRRGFWLKDLKLTSTLLEKPDSSATSGADAKRSTRLLVIEAQGAGSKTERLESLRQSLEGGTFPSRFLKDVSEVLKR